MTLSTFAGLASLAAVTLLPAVSWAANADQPYANVDKSNDQGNSTGDSKVDTLNKGQLDENQKLPPGASSPGSPSAVPSAASSGAAPQGSAPARP